MMWGGRRYDDDYVEWFAWYPVKLSGPMEWNRMRFDGRRARWAWLRTVWRMRSQFGTYYAVEGNDT